MQVHVQYQKHKIIFFLQTFSKEQLSKFLKEKQYAEYIVESFEKEVIDGESFLELTDDELSYMNIKIGDKKKLLKLIHLMEAECSVEPPSLDSQAASEFQKKAKKSDLDIHHISVSYSCLML